MKRAIDLALFMAEDTAPAPAETRGEPEIEKKMSDLFDSLNPFSIPAETLADASKKGGDREPAPAADAPASESKGKDDDLFDLSLFSTATGGDKISSISGAMDSSDFLDDITSDLTPSPAADAEEKEFENTSYMRELFDDTIPETAEPIVTDASAAPVVPASAAPGSDATVETAPIEPTAPTETRGEGEPPTPAPADAVPPAPPAEPVVTDAGSPESKEINFETIMKEITKEVAKTTDDLSKKIEPKEVEKRVKTTDDLPKKIEPKKIKKIVKTTDVVTDTPAAPADAAPAASESTGKNDDLIEFDSKPVVPGSDTAPAGTDASASASTEENDVFFDVSPETEEKKREFLADFDPLSTPAEPVVTDAPVPGPETAPVPAAPETGEPKTAQEKLDNYLKEVEGYIVDYEDVNNPYVKEINRLKEEVEKDENIKNQVENASKDFKEKTNTVNSKKEDLERLDADFEKNAEMDGDYYEKMFKERNEKEAELEQAERELELSEIFATIVDGLGGSTEDKVPVVKEYNEILDTTDDITEKISLAGEFAKKIELGRNLEEKTELARGFKNVIDKNKELSEKEKEVEKIENNKGTEADLNKAKKEALQAGIEVQKANIESKRNEIKIREEIADEEGKRYLSEIENYEGKEGGEEINKLGEKSAQAANELTKAKEELGNFENEQKRLEEELNRLNDKIDMQDLFDDIDDSDKSLTNTNNNIPITTTNDEQDLSAKTLGEKIANKISNYFSLEEVRKRREDRKLFFNTIKSNVRKFVFKKLNFEKVVNKVTKIKKKIKRKVKDLKETVSTYIKNKINLEKLIERGKEIVQKVAQKIGKSIDNAKLYFTDRVKYYTNKASTITNKTAKKVDELSSEKNAIDKKLENVTKEDLTRENLSLKEKGDKLEKKINKKIIKMNEKLEKIGDQIEKAGEKKEIAKAKHDIEDEINNNINTKKLKEDIKSLKKERRKLKFENVKLKIAETFCEKLGFKVENEKNEKALNEQKINNNQFELGTKQEMLKEVRKAKLQKTFSNDKTKLEQTLENLKQANKTLQSSLEVNNNSLSV